MSRKNAITFNKPPEPAFLKAFKEKVGYKEGPSVDTKRQSMPVDDEGADDSVEREDEKPTVVVLKRGDLTEAEAERARLSGALEEEDGANDGKMKFRKPEKRSNDGGDELSEKRKKSSTKKVNNKTLLSFDEDEEDT